MPQWVESSKTYFLVLGVGRGGTTLLANCLDAHPDICCLNEAADDPLRGKTGAQYAVLRRLAAVPGLSRLAAPLESWVYRRQDPGAARRGVPQALGRRRARAFYDQIQADLAGRPAPIAGNKITTESLAMIYRVPFAARESVTDDPYEPSRREALDYFGNQLFAAYRFIFIARDGRRVVESKKRRAALPPAVAAARWLECVRIHQALAVLLGERLLTVTFEMLVAQPETTLRRAAEFLGAAYDERMLAGAQRAYANETHQGFDVASLVRPLPTEYDDLLRPGLQYFNYPE